MHRVIERILNLLAFLLTADRPVTAEEIRFTVAGYDQESDAAFRRTFERDKDLLRGLGVPLTLQPTDVWEVEEGYVVPSDEYSLEDPGLTDEERAALWLAAQVVRLGGQAPDPAAVFKLGGAPMAGGGEPLAADLGASAESLVTLFDAVAQRKMVHCSYRGEDRTIAPYGLAHRRGHWYLVGDQQGAGTRAFRVDRMAGVDLSDAGDAFTRPEGFRVETALADAPWEAGEDEITVTVDFDAEVAWWARRQLTSRASITESADGGLRADFPVANVDSLIGWLIGFEDGAEIVEPEQIRTQFVAHLRGQP